MYVCVYVCMGIVCAFVCMCVFVCVIEKIKSDTFWLTKCRLSLYNRIDMLKAPEDEESMIHEIKVYW